MNGRPKVSPDKRSSKVDWTEIHQRLKRAQALLDQRQACSPEEKAAILEARALKLAADTEPKARQDHSLLAVPHLNLIDFLVADERYGLESQWVREVVPLKEFTVLPSIPRFVLGITNVRGQIISIININKVFDLPEKGISDFNRLIITESETMVFGILASSVFGVSSVPVTEIQTSISTLRRDRAEFLKGITNSQIVILDGQKLLSDRRIIVSEETREV